jgi:uncharacterized membrane protein
MNNGAQSVTWEVELWPNRSLSKRGLRVFLLLLAGCFSVFFLMTATAPGSTASRTGLATVLLVIVPFILVVFGFVVWAFAVNNRDGRYLERIHFDGETLVVEANHPKRPPRRWEFQPYWTRVLTRDTRQVEKQLILRQRDRAVAIGSFLTPEERSELAEEIRAALSRFNGVQA